MLKRVMVPLYHKVCQTIIAGRNPDMLGDCSGPHRNPTPISTIVDEQIG